MFLWLSGRALRCGCGFNSQTHILIMQMHCKSLWIKASAKCINVIFDLLSAAVIMKPCANPGNPVFSCVIKPGSPPLDLLYKTTSSDHGARSPTFESSPCSYHPISQSFSQHLGLCGMLQDKSFNTSLDHRYVYIPNYNTSFKGE